MPVLWLRDPDGRWHTARPARSAPLRDTDDFLLWLRVVPPVRHGTLWIDAVVAGSSAGLRARLPLSWMGRSLTARFFAEPVLDAGPVEQRQLVRPG